MTDTGGNASFDYDLLGRLTEWHNPFAETPAGGEPTHDSGLGAVHTPERLAEAIDVADDLAGHPKLELDLSDELAWQELALSPPHERHPWMPIAATTPACLLAS